MGGETFLHPDLDILLDYAKKSNKIGIIEITTNAVVNIPEKVLRELKSPKVLVMISDYGFNKNKVVALTKMFKQRSINFKVLHQEKWIDFGYPKNYGGSWKELEKKYMNCIASGLCTVLYKGKMMICGRGPFLYEKGLLSNQYIDVTDACFSAQSLYRFYTDIRYNFCNYCDFQNRIIRGGQQIQDKEQQ